MIPVRMVEGHGCHRVAHAHRKLLLNKRFVATSPNKRFTEGAEAVQNQPLTRIEVHGKNLFYFFGDAANPRVVHIHFGMSGAFKTMTLPGPEATETTRLTLVNQEHGIIAHLSAMTVILGDLDYYKEKSGKLGPDPLRQDADGERLWEKMRKSKKPIGGILMDQTCIAGIGNIYRAEILFKAGVHPEQPAWSVSREGFEALWRHSVLLLQRGFKTGSILTVDEDEAKKLGKPWTRRYVYNHNSCGRCGSTISTWDMQTRTVYACEVCQPLRLDPGTELAPGRISALKASMPTRQFKSHCAPEAAAQAVPAQMTVKELKVALEGLGLDGKGTKKVLVERLKAAQAAAKGADEAEPSKPTGPVGGVKPGLDQDESKPLQGPEPLMGTQHLKEVEQGHMASGDEAAPVDQDLAKQQEIPPAKMTVPQLKEQLKTFNMPVSGKKADLVHRLETALSAAAATGHASDAMSPGTTQRTDSTAAPDSNSRQPLAAAVAQQDANDGIQKAAPSADLSAGEQQRLAATAASVGLVDEGQQQQAATARGAELAGGYDSGSDEAGPMQGGLAGQDGLADVQPGTEGLGDVMTAEDAAREKAAAGEGRNVEHVAEANDMTHAAADSKKRRRKPAQRAEATQQVQAEGRRTTRRRKAP